MVVEELVTFIGKAGDRQATIFYEEEYIQPYRVEYYSEDKNLGFIYFLNKERAEESARAFAFGD
jgi:hypothetical protein